MARPSPASASPAAAAPTMRRRSITAALLNGEAILSRASIFRVAWLEFQSTHTFVVRQATASEREFIEQRIEFVRSGKRGRMQEV